MLITAPTCEPVTLDDVKSQLGISSADTASDTQLNRRITEARKWAEDHTKSSLMPQVHELRLNALSGSESVALPFPPVVSIVSVNYIDSNGDLTELNSSNYVLDNAGHVAYIRPAYGISWPSARNESGAFRIRYSAGYATTAIDSAIAITAITAATPGVCTSVAHGYANGDLIKLSIAGMTELDDLLYRVYAKTNDTFQLAKLSNDGAISTVSMTAFTSGTAQKVEVAVPETIIECIILLIGHWTNFQNRIEGGNFITRVPVAIEQLLDSNKFWGLQ